MTEKDAIKLIRKARTMKPREGWAASTRLELFGIAEKAPVLTWRAYALIPAACFSLFAGLFVFSKTSLPGDTLYPVKRLAEKARTEFVSQDQKVNVQLDLNEQRLTELSTIAETNQAKRLAPALEELKTVKTEVKKEVAKMVKERPEDAKEVALKLKAINEKEGEVLTALGIEGEEEGEEDAEKAVVEVLLQDLVNDQAEKEKIEEVEKEYEAGNYRKALEMILLVNYPQD